MLNYDEELTDLDEGIRRLKIEYDIFFSGNRKKPPDDQRLRIDRIVKRLAEATDMSLSQRFRYNTLISRFCVYRDLWRRTQMERESAQEDTRVLSDRASQSTEKAATCSQGVQVSIEDPAAEADKIRHLYDELLRIRGRNTKDSPGISYQQFMNYIAGQTQDIKAKYRCAGVIFRIALEKDSIKFTAKADTRSLS